MKRLWKLAMAKKYRNYWGMGICTTILIWLGGGIYPSSSNPYWKITMTQLGFLVAFMLLAMVGFIIYAIVTVIRNERRFTKFRKELKVGDETDQGVITRIEGEAIYTEKRTRIDSIYPYESQIK